MTVHGTEHRQNENHKEGYENAGVRRIAVGLRKRGRELRDEVGERCRRHREKRHLPPHVRHVPEEGRDLVAVVAERKARLHERGKPRTDAADGKNAHERARKEVPDHARGDRLPD